MQVDLSGPQGNAFVIGGMAVDVARRLGRSDDQIEAMKARFGGGTYNDLLDMIELEFPCLFRFVNDPRNAASEKRSRQERDLRFASLPG